MLTTGKAALVVAAILLTPKRILEFYLEYRRIFYQIAGIFVFFTVILTVLTLGYVICQQPVGDMCTSLLRTPTFSM